VVDRSARRWTQTFPKNVNMDSSDENAFVRIMYFLDEMVSTSLSNFARLAAHPKFVWLFSTKANGL
jgi:hypothetical protein